MPATFTVDAYPGQEFCGTVTSIRKAPINVQNVITYDVVIAVDNTDLKLFPGMTANVKIQIETHENVLKVPDAALRYRAPEEPETGQPVGANPPTVWVLDAKNRPRAVRVALGISDGVYTEITSGGLREGDQLIVAARSSEPNHRGVSPFGGGRRGF